ncbi:MAG: hypothetical protein F7C35_03345 [Desulfurococcales archaeon]|nr:hypothetical protein [Desulfurococcales archaeon]
MREVARKRGLFNKVFSRDALVLMEDEEFMDKLRSVLMSLWSFRRVPRKVEDRVEQILSSNDLRDLRFYFYVLLYSDLPLSVRLDKAVDRIKGLRTASITEILCFVDPRRYAIWNKRVVKALDMLDLFDDWRRVSGLGSRDYEAHVEINGRRYELALRLLEVIRRHYSLLIGREVNFLDLDVLLYYISMQG